eukprot:TRINITY_DN428_c0_g1_i1.p1 TRINITY_DN428_c0_g1~~TRINITY_DN428_c0_g1_i1.p1  ORF type:complete len:606 (-),score=103.80 TRINITY_DN428_c0_g1_i1:43-1860(-)
MQRSTGLYQFAMRGTAAPMRASTVPMWRSTSAFVSTGPMQSTSRFYATASPTPVPPITLVDDRKAKAAAATPAELKEAAAAGCPFAAAQQQQGNFNPAPPQHTSTASSLPTTPPPELFGSTTATPERKPAKPYSEMPGPKGLPFIGQLRDLMNHTRQRQELWDKWYKEFGPIFKYTVLGEDQVMIYDPELIKDVFSEEPLWPQREALPAWVKYREVRKLPLGMALAQDQEWKRYRSVVNKLLVPANVDAHVERVWDVASKMSSDVHRRLNKNNQAVGFADTILGYGLEAIVAVSMGRKLGLFEPEDSPTVNAEQRERREKFIEAVTGMFDTSDELVFGVPLWKLYETPLLKKHYQHWDELFAIAAELQDDLTSTDENRYNDNVTNLMDHVRNNGQEKLTETETNVTCAELIAAGVDTTANAAGFAIYHIAKNPEAQQRLYEEITSVMGDAPVMTQAHLRKMPFLKNCVTESMRLNPAVDANSRYFKRDVEIGGYQVPAGTRFALHVWTTGREEAFFNDALTFNPDRHSRDGDGKAHHAFASLPFGSGARSCPGRRIATMEVQVALANLVKNFEIRYPYDIRVRTSLLVKPVITDHEPLTFIPRNV